MWEREPGVVAVRWSAAASPRLLDGLLATGSACVSLDGVSGEPVDRAYAHAHALEHRRVHTALTLEP